MRMRVSGLRPSPKKCVVGFTLRLILNNEGSLAKCGHSTALPAQQVYTSMHNHGHWEMIYEYLPCTCIVSHLFYLLIRSSKQWYHKMETCERSWRRPSERNHKKLSSTRKRVLRKSLWLWLRQSNWKLILPISNHEHEVNVYESILNQSFWNSSCFTLWVFWMK